MATLISFFWIVLIISLSPIALFLVILFGLRIILPYALPKEYRGKLRNIFSIS